MHHVVTWHPSCSALASKIVFRARSCSCAAGPTAGAAQQGSYGANHSASSLVHFGRRPLGLARRLAGGWLRHCGDGGCPSTRD